MTSKSLFFKAMKEDLRHKIWMIALSTLGSFLALPVAWLIWRSNEIDRYGGVEGLLMQSEKIIQEKSEWIVSFFAVYLPVVCGILGILGAVIVGLFGFRYVFHRRMVDTYHSLPIKRSTLYGACYVNGILIWFVPLLVCLLPALIMGGSLMSQLGAGGMLGGMLKELGVNLLILLVVYLTVYHLVLTAVMLSGNTLNTLVCMFFLGFGAISYYGLGLGCFRGYMDTFYGSASDWSRVLYATPLLSAPYLISLRVELSRFQWTQEFWEAVLANVGIAAALGIAAWLLYRARASETAGQGIGNRAVAACFRSIIGAGAGICGWGLFVLLVSNSRALGWGIFGAVLVSVLVFGLLDIIFQMDFKAFFSHKIQMAVTVALGLLVCSAFYWDWIGYDAYLPDKDDIAEIAVYDDGLSNRIYYGAEQEALERMSFQDSEVIYAYLEKMAGREREDRDFFYGEYDRVTTKVTLKNGRSYYRTYRVGKGDQEFLWPVVTSEEYLENAWLLDENSVDDCIYMGLHTDSEWEEPIMSYGANQQAILLPVIRAYNQDVLEHTDDVVLGRGRCVADIELEFRHEKDGHIKSERISLYIYDSMEHTVEAIQQIFSVSLAQESEIRSIAIDSGHFSDENEDGGQMYITDRAEIEELSAMLSFIRSYRHYSVFQGEPVEVRVTMEDGEERTGYLEKEALPEKYILRYGDF